jgi:hypothetical protein
MENLRFIAVLNTEGHETLVNLEQVTSVEYIPDDRNPTESLLYLRFDREYSVVAQGDEAQRVWDNLSKKGKTLYA